MDDLITYAEGSNILGTDFSSWEDRVEMNGTGKSYGLELFLKKNKGKLTGWWVIHYHEAYANLIELI